MIGKCKTCKQEKQLARYQKISGGRFYFRKHCITCWSAEREGYQKEYRNENKEKLKLYDADKYARNRMTLNANSRRYYRKLQDQCFNHYGNQCSCCGEREKNFLTLDHKNNDGANHRRKIGVGHIFYRWIIDNDYPSSIQLLCYNCNAGKHRNGGSCPHGNTYKSQSDFAVYYPFTLSMGI